MQTIVSTGTSATGINRWGRAFAEVDNGCQLTILADKVLGVRSPEELSEIFRATGRKVTPQRRSIFRVLHGADHHPTAEEVYETVRTEMPTISLRTVYQTLNDLAAMGEIQPVDLGTGSARFDPHIAPHHHMVCTGCGWVADVAEEFPQVTPPAGPDSGFEVATTEIVFRGRCAACAATAGVEAAGA
jgi:Fe2+ or Zn2+ uptake regulation protein